MLSVEVRSAGDHKFTYSIEMSWVWKITPYSLTQLGPISNKTDTKINKDMVTVEVRSAVTTNESTALKSFWYEG